MPKKKKKREWVEAIKTKIYSYIRREADSVVTRLQRVVSLPKNKI